MHISGEFLAIGICFHNNSLVPTLKQVAAAPSFCVIVVCVSAIYMMENLGKVGSRGLQENVIVIGHQTVDVNNSSISIMGRLEVGEKFFPVRAAFEYRLPFITAGGNVVPSPRELNS